MRLNGFYLVCTTLANRVQRAFCISRVWRISGSKWLVCQESGAVNSGFEAWAYGVTRQMDCSSRLTKQSNWVQNGMLIVVKRFWTCAPTLLCEEVGRLESLA